MTSQDNAYIATGIGTMADFVAAPGKKATPATWGFLTAASEARFTVGGSFSGLYHGAECFGGEPDDSGKIGPTVNDYSRFSGVFGAGVSMTGVAGISTNNVGVYGQTEEDPTTIPGGIRAGVFGAAYAMPAIVAWSTKGTGIQSFAYQDRAVLGVSEYGLGVHGRSTTQPGVQGISHSGGPTIPNPITIAGVEGTSDTVHGVIGSSTTRIGVFGYSANDIGIFGATGKTSSYAGFFDGRVSVLGDVIINGNFQVVGAGHTKSAAVPFPDGSQRLLYCMESPELWFEDFGSAKLARGRAVVKLDANFAKVIKRGDYRVFVTPEGDCRGLYVRRKTANSFTVRELMGGKSSIAFSYRIVGRRKDIKGHRRFAKIDIPPPLPTRPPRASRKPVPTAAGLRAFVARVEKEAREARERAPKGAEKARARMRRKRA